MEKSIIYKGFIIQTNVYFNGSKDFSAIGKAIFSPKNIVYFSGSLRQIKDCVNTWLKNNHLKKWEHY